MEDNIETKIKEQAMLNIKKCLGYIPSEVRPVIEHAIPNIINDLSAYTSKDPAAHDYEEMVIKAYASFNAVMLYRISNKVYYNTKIPNNLSLAEQLSEYAKLISGIKIHPKAIIGNAFVIDHGYGTMIDETLVIGNNCYILNNVKLGTGDIINDIGTSHRTIIGNNVQIGASAKIIGDIEIGDNCFIGPDVEITESVPANSKYLCIRIQQESKYEDNYQILDVKKKRGSNQIQISGTNLKKADLECFIENSDKTITKLNILSKTKDKIKIELINGCLKMKKVFLTFKDKQKTISKLSISNRFLL